jgi:predicted molibdopterin-dependent oxidoreductase YjgC
VFRHTRKYHESRGFFCGIGHCTDCIMEVDGIPNVRTCITPVQPGMIIRTGIGLSDSH